MHSPDTHTVTASLPRPFPSRAWHPQGLHTGALLPCRYQRGVVQLQAEAVPRLQDTAAVQTEAVLVLLKFIIFII